MSDITTPLNVDDGSFTPPAPTPEAGVSAPEAVTPVDHAAALRGFCERAQTFFAAEAGAVATELSHVPMAHASFIAHLQESLASFAGRFKE